MCFQLQLPLVRAAASCVEVDEGAHFLDGQGSSKCDTSSNVQALPGAIQTSTRVRYYER